MKYTVSEVLRFVEENDVKFIRLAFCDIFGTQKNISIMPSELPRAFERGISFDASSIMGFLNIEESDLFLVPDPGTLTILPWRPSHGRVVRLFCAVKNPDGTQYAGNTRAILRNVVDKLQKTGYVCKVGTECEFYLFENGEDGMPTDKPMDYGGYFDISPLDKGENVRREICLTLEQMDIMPENSHHEHGPGQNEIDFKYSGALNAADNLVAFKSVVKTIAARNGLYASFMPKPISNKSGNGLHINISVHKDGRNIFENLSSPAAKSFVAGILSRARDITLFLNPTTNSYSRFGAFDAPKYVTWSHQNRSQFIRIPASSGDLSRLEVRSPDPSCNPYLAIALLISAGIEGIENRLELVPALNKNLFEAGPEDTSSLELLPQTLGEAIDAAENSEFVRSALPESTLQKFVGFKKEEWARYQNAVNKEEFENNEYFFTV